MKAALFFLLVAIVAAYAVEVDVDFVKSALAFKEHVMKRDAEQSVDKRAMLGVNWSKSMNGNCSPIGIKCHMFQTCCNPDEMKCNNFLNGVCVPRV